MLDNRFSYQRNFTHINLEQESFPSVELGQLTGSHTDTDSGKPNNSQSDVPTRQIWTGYFFLSFRNVPAAPANGWQFGSGRWKAGSAELKEPFGEVELLLTTGRSGTSMRGVHGKFFFHRETGMIMLSARHKVLDGITLDHEAFTNGHRALNCRSVHMSIDRMEYQVIYVLQRGSVAEQTYQKAKSDFFESRLQATTPMPSLSATPSQTDHIVGEWVFHDNVGQGGTALATAASDKMGKAVVVKTLIRSDQSARSIDQEIQAARELTKLLDSQKHLERVIRLVDVLYQDGSAIHLHGRLETVWILYTPLASGTFTSLIIQEQRLRRPAETTILILFRQVLQGLSFLHGVLWVHRDIKPNNVGIVSFDPPRAVILDIGCAQLLPKVSSKFQQTPGRNGTIGYLAPEMEYEPYNEAVDIWAAGIMPTNYSYRGTHGQCQ